MRDKLIITNILYKAILNRNFTPPESDTRIVSEKNGRPAFIAYIEPDNKSARLIADNSPSLGITGARRYKIAVESPFKTVVSPIGYARDNDGIRVSDVIYEGKSLDYGGDEPVLAMCGVILPDGVTPGEYSLKARLYESVGLNDETLVGEASVILAIKDYASPAPEAYSIYTDIWQHNSNIARAFGVELWSGEHLALIDKTLKKLKRLGQKSITVIASDCPWRGWGCYLMRDTPANLFEYGVVKTSRSADGDFTYDYSALDRLLKLYSDNGINGDITVYGLIGIWRMPYFNTAQPDFPEAVKIGYTDESDGAYKYMTKRRDIINYVAALFNHFKSLGLWDKVRIGADEPSVIEPFNEALEILKSVAPDIKLKIAMDKPEVIGALKESCTDICLSFPCTTKSVEDRTDYGGARRLWYVCNIPDRPNSVLKNSLWETAALGVLNHAFGYDGFLRWAFTCWTISPLDDIRFNPAGLPSGDVCLVYPSPAGAIYESLRFRALEYGIKLYELLNAIKKSDEEKFNSLLSTVVADRKDFFKICGGVGISKASADYIMLYDKALDYLESAGGKL